MRLGELFSALALKAGMTNADADELRLKGNQVEAVENTVSGWVQGDPTQISKASVLAGADNVVIDGLGIRIYYGPNFTGWMQTDGDWFVGSDITSADTTVFSIFSNAQTYNGEALNAGTLLIGSNSSGFSNIRYDPSTGQLEFRGGTTVQAYVGTDGVIYAGGGNAYISTSGFHVANNAAGLIFDAPGGGSAASLTQDDAGNIVLDFSGTLGKLVLKNSTDVGLQRVAGANDDGALTLTAADSIFHGANLVLNGYTAASSAAHATIWIGSNASHESKQGIFGVYSQKDNQTILQVCSSPEGADWANKGIRLCESGPIINEFSTDTTMAAATNSLIYTGLAVKTYIDTEVAGAGGGEPGPGYLVNGKLSVSVAANDLTVAIKTLAGNDPSAGDPVTVRIGDTIRTITAALSVTKNDGTNWCKLGASETATLENDLFAYLGYNATDGIVIGFSRIPFAHTYADFSTTSTNEKYCGISTITNAAATDQYENIGRFNAILSAAAGYTWSIPATALIISKPTYNTRILLYSPTFSASAPMTWTRTAGASYYQIQYDQVFLTLWGAGTTGGTASASLLLTSPFTGNYVSGFGSMTYDTTRLTAYSFFNNQPTAIVTTRKPDTSNYGLGANRDVVANLFFKLS